MMSNDTQNAHLQKLIRRKIIRSRTELSAGYRESASTTIADKVIKANFFQRALTIGCYLSTETEVDTSAIILRAQRMKKRIFAPVITENRQLTFRQVSANCDVRPNRFGIMEPASGETISPRQLDIVLTPGVAFDDDGNRIGMGGGYFDHTFSHLGGRRLFFRPKLIGLAFDCQKVEKITANPWDIRVFCTVTEMD